VLLSENKLVDFRFDGHYLQIVMKKSAHKNINWWWPVKQHTQAVAFL